MFSKHTYFSNHDGNFYSVTAFTASSFKFGNCLRFSVTNTLKIEMKLEKMDTLRGHSKLTC